MKKRKKQSNKTKNTLSSQIKTALVLFFLLCTIIAIFKSFSTNKKSTAIKTYHTNLIVSDKAESSASASLLPTATPIPQANQAAEESKTNGYCLNVPVLYYHHIQPQAQAISKKQTGLSVDNGVFDQQMSYLMSHGYTTITAKQLVDLLRSHGSLIGKSIVVTIDDGYKDAYMYAFPILQKYHINVSLFIATGLLDGNDYLSWSQLQEMKNSGLIYFVDHTWSHYSLPKGDAAKIQYEIQTAKQQLEQHFGQTVDIFGYPYGSFNGLSAQLLQQNGFLGAYSTQPGTYQCDSFIMTLHRTRIGNSPLSYYGL